MNVLLSGKGRSCRLLCQFTLMWNSVLGLNFPKQLKHIPLNVKKKHQMCEQVSLQVRILFAGWLWHTFCSSDYIYGIWRVVPVRHVCILLLYWEKKQDFFNLRRHQSIGKHEHTHTNCNYEHMHKHTLAQKYKHGIHSHTCTHKNLFCSFIDIFYSWKFLNIKVDAFAKLLRSLRRAAKLHSSKVT